MALKFSVPYQGSKQGIAEEIFEVIHNREGEKKRYFYDLFGGGGAMSFLAQIKGYEVVYNELNEDIAQFIDFIINNKETCEYGSFPREFYNFVDKKTFNKIRDTKKITPYKTFVLLTYSFGNSKQNYFCSPDKEKYKREGHNLVVFLNYKDFSNYKERYQKQIQFLDEHQEYCIVGTCADVFDDNGSWGTYNVPEKPQREDFLWNSPFMHPTVMMRKENIRGGYREAKETRRCEDYDLFMNLYANGYKGYNIQEKLYCYRIVRDEKHKHRPMKYRVDEMIVRYQGYKRMGILIKGIPYVLKPVIIGLIPQFLLNKIMQSRY